MKKTYFWGGVGQKVRLLRERTDKTIIVEMLTGLHVVAGYLLDPALVMLLSSLIDGGFGKLCQC